MNKRTRERGNRRLLNVAKALRESPAPDKFTMALFGSVNGCVSPACALGHYASRKDLQKAFKLTLEGYKHNQVWLRLIDESTVGYNGDAVQKHFDVDVYEAEDLFGPSGCGHAENPLEAAAYIESFVANRSATP